MVKLLTIGRNVCRWNQSKCWCLNDCWYIARLRRFYMDKTTHTSMSDLCTRRVRLETNVSVIQCFLAQLVVSLRRDLMGTGSIPWIVTKMSYWISESIKGKKFCHYQREFSCLTTTVSKNCQKFSFYSKNWQWQFFWKNEIFGIFLKKMSSFWQFLTFNWKFSGGSDSNSRPQSLWSRV